MKLFSYAALRVLPLLFVLLTPVALLADHIVGGEFTYECIGFKDNDPTSGIRTYRVTINMYRDCIGEGAWFDGDMDGVPNGLNSSDGHISIYDGEMWYRQNFPISLIRWEPVDVNLGNPCLVITDNICQQIGIYEFEVDLPVTANIYNLVYQRCCRNEDIRNILSPDQVGSTYFIRITPESQERCNSSPVFNIDPPIAICINQPFQIDLGATDADGDSLVYKFCDPKIGAGRDCPRGPSSCQTATTFDDIVPEGESNFPYTSVSWAFPTYSLSDQLGTGSTLTVNDSTGLLEGRPIYPGTHVLGVCIEEWSRDSIPILLSETKREFQLNVARCDNTVLADLLETELDDQGRFFIRQCGPGENTIINESTDENFITRYDWELTGPGNSLINGRSRDFVTNIDQVGVYEGVMVLNSNSFAENCRDTAIFMLGVYPKTNADFEASEVVCDPAPIDFTDLSTVDGSQQITGYAWDFADTSALSTQRNPSHLYRIPGDFNVSLTVTDDNGCTDQVVKPTKYFPAPRTILVDPPDGFACVPYSRTFVNRSFPIDNDYEFEWEFGDGATSTDRDPSHTYETPGIYSVYLGITSPLGCFVDTTFQRIVDAREAPIADFTFNPDPPTNVNPEFSILDRSVDANSVRYVVTDNAGLELFSTAMPNFDYRLRDTSTVYFNQVATHPSGCRDTLIKPLNLVLKNTFHAPNAFTPNGDGLNDVWRPKGIWLGATNYTLKVWTRWGELVYTTNIFEEGWDGTFRGKQSPAGGYLWHATFLNAESKPESIKGGVVLVR